MRAGVAVLGMGVKIIATRAWEGGSATMAHIVRVVAARMPHPSQNIPHVQ